MNENQMMNSTNMSSFRIPTYRLPFGIVPVDFIAKTDARLLFGRFFNMAAINVVKLHRTVERFEHLVTAVSHFLSAWAAMGRAFCYTDILPPRIEKNNKTTKQVVNTKDFHSYRYTNK